MSRWIAHVLGSVEPEPTTVEPRSDVKFAGRVATMPETDWLILEANKDGVFLLRYSEAGEFGGDTWTPTRELALEVASEEFGLTDNDWIEVPANVIDAIQFAKSRTAAN